jgi:branched-subunit amino acid ABC-type transport system permease component
MTELLQLLIDGLVAGSIFALAGVGLSLPFGVLRVVNFAQGEYVTCGAYAAVVVNLAWHANMFIAAISAMLAVAVLSYVLEVVYWRPMRKARAGHFAMLLSSFGLALAIRGLLLMFGGSATRTYDFNKFQVYTFAGVRLSQSQLVAVILGFASVIAVALLFSRTHTGRTMRALADDQSLAAVAGVNTDRLIKITWMVSGALTGLAGVLQGLLQISFDPNMGASLLLPVFAAVVLGGLGNPYGALAGGLLLGVVMKVSTWSALGGGLSPIWENVVAFVVLVAVLLLRPVGIVGRAVAR